MSNSQELRTSKEVGDEEEDYIKMELNSSPSSPQTREFEFQMSSSATSPADELFYKGKLLPLHLPPRLQMEEHLLQSHSQEPFNNIISHSESCRFSCETNPDEMSSFVRNHPKSSWTKKLMKSSLGQKLITLFGKSGCSNEPSSVNPVSNRVENLKDEEGCISQRRSLSGVIQWHPSSRSSVSTSSSGSSSSSSSFSFSSNNGFNDLHFLRRSGSACSELEESIEEAIAHCKMSHQQLISSRKTTSNEVIRPGCSLFASGFKVPQDHERPKIVTLL